MSDVLRTVSAQVVRTLCGGRTDGVMMKDPRRGHGFTLIELMLVTTITGILAAVAMPSLTRARAVSVEVSTIGTLRSLGTAQASFASSCGSGSYAPNVASLAKPPGKGNAAFIGPGFTANTTDKAGYRIRFTAGAVVKNAPATCNGLGAGQTVQSYYIAADPLQVGSGLPTRYFGTSASGTIFQGTSRVKAFYSGVPGAPAKPIQ